jgi:type IX secretion system PorP/SprF family membrane protein
MDKNNHIDDLFRSKLSDYQPEYVPEHWQMLKAAIESSPKAIPVSSGNFTAKLLIALSAVIIVGSGIYTYLLTQKVTSSASNENTIAQLQPVNNTFNVTNNSDRNVSSTENTISPVKKTNTPLQPKNVVIENNVPANPGSDNKKSNKNNIQIQSSAITSSGTKAANTSLNNNKNEKPLVNNTEVTALARNEGDENNSEQKKDIIKEQPVSDINIQQNITETNLNNQETNKTENQIVEDNKYSSVTDDYLAKKEKLEKKNKRIADRKENTNKGYESLPDCKVSMVNNFVVNPAYAGFNQRHTISLSTLIHKPLYKPSNDFNIPFEYSIAYDFNFGKRKNCGIGVNYKRYLGAAEGSLAVDLTFAYRIFLAKDHNLRLGFSASYLASDINKDNLSFSDMIDSRDGFVYNTNETFPAKTASSNFDMGMGVWYNWKTLFVGVSAVHLTSPEIGVISKSRIPREYMLSAGYGFNMGKVVSALPALELKYNERILNISPSMLFTYKRWLLFGMEFQNLRNAGLVLGFNVKNNVIINIHGGVPMNKDIMRNFGVVDYAGLSLRFQFGNYR